jgi:hypothetical protein
MPLFPDPASLLCFYDPYFSTGTPPLHGWQKRALKSFANRPTGRSKHINIVAPNGAGKSSCVLAGCAAWTAMSFQCSQTAITSASVAQLDAQTMRAIGRLAGHINAYHGAELWNIQGRKIIFTPNGSPIDARKSDEEGTQEGFHPIVPGGEFTILVDEAKTLSKGIYDGILKWTGFTRRVDITSAGDPCGPFYDDLCSNRHGFAQGPADSLFPLCGNGWHHCYTNGHP